MCYGIIYGMGTKALAEQLKVDETQASLLMSQFQSTFAGNLLHLSTCPPGTPTSWSLPSHFLSALRSHRTEVVRRRRDTAVPGDGLRDDAVR